MNDQFDKDKKESSGFEDNTSESSQKQEPTRPSDNDSGYSNNGFGNSPYQNNNRQNPNNQYPPPNGFYNNRPPQQNPYQYNPNRGWQNPNREEPQYQWNFDDYDRLDMKQSKRKKNKGQFVFGMFLLGLLVVSLISISAYGIYTSFVALPEQSATGTDSSQGDGSDSQTSTPSLDIQGKPNQDNLVPAIGSQMTIPQVAKSVSPSVVGVVQFVRADYYEPSGVGSGIIMSEDGYIITNAHVVQGSSDLKVILDNGEPYEAKLIGADAQTDLAVLKIEATGLVAAQFGSSKDLMVGETVVAIGNPAGMELAGSVTRGIISALDREVKTSSYAMNYIQTDAAINPGNSGGALVNEYGQVIGINSSKIVAEGYEGIGFAIPIDDARPIIEDIIANGRVTGRVVLGITATIVDEVDVRKYNVPLGLRVMSVAESSDIAAKGVQPRDIITHIDENRVTTLDEVKAVLQEHKAGDIVHLKVFRQLNLMQSSTYEVDIALMEDMG